MCQTKLDSKQQRTLRRKKTEKMSHQSAHLVEQESDSQESDPEELRLFTIRTVQSNHIEEIMVRLLINSVPVSMELDTGASVSLVSEKTWRKQLQEVPLQHSDTTLRTYTGEGIKVLGQVMVQIEFGNQEAKLPLLVVLGSGPSLIGRNWLKLIRLNWPDIKRYR